MGLVGNRLERVAYQSDQALEELRAFVAVVEAQGFRAAARVTQGRKATLSRRVQDLEARLGVPLLVRTTRSMRLTEEGRAYFEHASRALASARDAEAVVLSAKAEPRGVLRVTTSTALASLVLEDVVVQYLAKHPLVRVELHAAERRVDIVRDAFDLAVWGGALGDSWFVARRLGVASLGYFASPRYLARRPPPESPDDLAGHDTVMFTKGDGALEWAFLVGGKQKRFAIRPRLVLNNVELAARVAAAGLGIVRAPLSVVAPYMAKKKLVAVLRPWTPPGVDVHAVFPAGGTLVPKTRAFVDMLKACFDREPSGRRRAAGITSA